jgi:hypothetical protein
MPISAGTLTGHEWLGVIHFVVWVHMLRIRSFSTIIYNVTVIKCGKSEASKFCSVVTRNVTVGLVIIPLNRYY